MRLSPTLCLYWWREAALDVPFPCIGNDHQYVMIVSFGYEIHSLAAPCQLLVTLEVVDANLLHDRYEPCSPAGLIFRYVIDSANEAI
jgi:hypothetical protein